MLIKKLHYALLGMLTSIDVSSAIFAHEGRSHKPSPQTQQKIEQLNTAPAVRLVAMQNVATPLLAEIFKPFADKVKVRTDNDYLLVESNGMPDHPLMIGITAWQQQVPLPQAYLGENAWRIPLHPTPARNPLSAKDHFFRGAIALAANGVPIFNPIKNDGETDTLLAGELDQWGGHCGRADDYHYHIAPVHLEKIVGVGKPVAVALDGYPIYGYHDPDGKPPTNLDWLNGHKDSNGNYHYHATQTYPYLNGGFYGEVVERDGQVDPQPRAQSPRPALPPLRGAKITGFENPKLGSYIVRYEVSGTKHSVEYALTENSSATFNFVSPQGTKTENYKLRQGGGGDDRRQAERPGGLGGPGPGNPPPAQLHGSGPPPNDRPPRGGGGDLIVRALDANGDGQIDQAELRAAAKALLTLDRDNDGQLAADELRGGGGSRGPGSAGPPPQSAAAQPAEPPLIIAPRRSGNFKLTSSAVADGAPLPQEFNGDGEGATLPLQWTGAPEGTKSFAIVMDHLDRNNVMKTYWTVYDIPPTVTSIPKNMQGVGKLGATWKRDLSYVPPHSAGGGRHTYTLHIYALSAVPRFSTAEGEVTREVLLTKIKDTILDSDELSVTYAKPTGAASERKGGPGTPRLPTPAAASQRAPNATEED